MTDSLNIYQKLIEVRKKVPYLQKTEASDQYKYVSSSQVLSKVREEMDKQGLLLIPKVMEAKVTGDTVEKINKYNEVKHTTTYFTELTMEYIWVNAEKPEETIVCPWYGQGVDIAGEKGVGKALTYAEKYFLLKFFNIATDTDDPDSFQGKNESGPAGNQSTSWIITDEMINEIFDLGKRKGISAKGIKETIMKQFNKTEVKSLNEAEYAKLKKSLERLSDKPIDSNK